MLLPPLLSIVMGCAGASVTQQSQKAPPAIRRPDQIAIYPFAVDPEEVELNRGFLQRAYRSVAPTGEDEKQAEIADDLSQSVCLNAAADLLEKGYPAVCLPRGTAPTGANVIMVDGEFDNVSEGNRLSRTVIGFGAGSSTLDTSVYVVQRTNGTTQQIMQFMTHADSGQMPGVLVTGAPGAAAGGAAAVASMGVNMTVSAIKGYRSSMGSLGKMSADQIVDHLSQYFAQQGWNGGGSAAPTS
jgi:hypothetical protein